MEIKTKKAEETKNRLILSAQRLFNKKGFEATSIREIVEDAGYAKGTFYLYFETKMDILTYLANNLFGAFDNIISEQLSSISDDPFKQIDEVFKTLCFYMLEREGGVKMFHTHEMLELIMEQNISSLFINSIIDKISLFLKLGIERGHFRSVDTLLYSKMIFSIGHDMLESAILFEFPAEIEAVNKELMIIVRKILES